MLILSEKDLRRVLNIRDVIEAVEEGFRALARNDAVAPARLHLEVPESSGVLLEMPSRARLEAASLLGTKVVTVFDKNPSRNLDTVQAVYLLIDGETGEPLALLEGRFITAIRTAATSALATRVLAPDGGKRLAIFGAGVQARFHIEAMIEVAAVESVMIVSRTGARASALSERVRSLYGLACEVAAPDKAASRCNLICTCTGSPTPLFDGRLIQPGTHVNAVGAFTPSTRELDTEAIRRALVFIDAEEAAGREAGEILIPIAEGAIEHSHIRATLARVVTAQVPGRISPKDITIFKSSGLAVEDLVTANLAYEKAMRLGIGASLKL
jgi:ornithine cyclodeaminase/alanine dehydrogenase-like protein (mu-crystallin family)